MIENKKRSPLLFEQSKAGRISHSFSTSEVPAYDLTENIAPHLIRKQPARLPEVSELQLMRHYTRLSQNNFGIENGFYPLGSCTMKYNPKINEVTA